MALSHYWHDSIPMVPPGSPNYSGNHLSNRRRSSTLFRTAAATHAQHSRSFGAMRTREPPTAFSRLRLVQRMHRHRRVRPEGWSFIAMSSSSRPVKFGIGAGIARCSVPFPGIAQQSKSLVRQRETSAWTPASRAHASRWPPRPATPPLLAHLPVRTDQIPPPRASKPARSHLTDTYGDQLSLRTTGGSCCHAASHSGWGRKSMSDSPRKGPRL